MTTFPLSDVQLAYWIGRNAEIPLGQTPCHVYMEFDGKEVDFSRLQRAWSMLFVHHPALCARIKDNGRMEIAQEPKDAVVLLDWSAFSKSGAERESAILRDRLSHRKMAVEDGETAGLTLARLEGGNTRLFFDLDLLVCDVRSFQIVLRDLADAYAHGTLHKTERWDPAQIREVMKADREAAKEARIYWTKNLSLLPGTPRLPLATDPNTLKGAKYKTHIESLPASSWRRLKHRAKDRKAEPALVLLSAFAAVLSAQGKSRAFLINMPLFDRPDAGPGIADAVGDFTRIMLMPMEIAKQATFAELLEKTCADFAERANHSASSGVALIGRLAAQRNGQMVAPVVFAPSLQPPLLSDTFISNLGRLRFMASQTPQVWLDAQFFEMEEGLLISFVEAEHLFSDGFVKRLTESCKKLLAHLADDAEDWHMPLDIVGKPLICEGGKNALD